MPIVNVGCVLKTGGDYQVDHVGALDYSLKRHCHRSAKLVCFTDVPDQVRALGVEAIPLEQNNPGWWSVPEVFRLQGHTIVVGLDTVFVRDMRSLVDVALNSTKDDFWMIRNLGVGTGPASGIMVWNGDWKWIYDDFSYKNVSKQLRGDEDWTLAALKSKGLLPKILQKEYNGDQHGGPIEGIYSYKRDVRGKIAMPDDAFVIVFHGRPRPHEIFHAWRRLNYPLTGEVGRV